MAKKIREWVIGIMAVAGLILYVGDATNQEIWLEVMICKAIVSLALWGLAYLLYEYWGKRGLLPDDDYEDEFI